MKPTSLPQPAGPAADAEFRHPHLGELPSSLPPTDRPERSRETSDRAEAVIPSAVASFDLSARATAQLRETTGPEYGLPTAVLAGLIATLHRFTGQDDIAVGVLRDGAETARAVRVRLGGHAWHDLLAQVRRAYEQIRELPPPAHEPEFTGEVPAVVDFGDPAAHPARRPGFAGQPGVATALFAGVSSTPTGSLVTVLYGPERWDARTMVDFSRSWQHLLETVADRPGIDIRDSALLTVADRQRLQVWNGTARPLPEPATVDALFRRHAGRSPGSPAVRDSGREWTYAEVDSWSDAIAADLIAAGVQQGTAVGLHLHRSPELVVAMLAVVKAGAAYLMLNPRYPAPRLALLAGTAQVAAVLTAGGWDPAGDAATVAFRAWDEVPAEMTPGTAPLPVCLPDSPANIVFTSGSTGRPKGVSVTHRGIVRLVTETDYVRLSERDVIVHLGDPAFDITTFEVWGALCNGATVAVLPGDRPLGPDEVIAAVNEFRPTVLSLTGMLFNRVTDTDPTAFRSLRYLFVVGEVMNVERTRRVLQMGPPRYLVNGYGPTENTTFSTCHHITALAPDAASVPIGTAITNTTAYVLDDALRPLPVGGLGELYVGGSGVALGYLGRPRATAERFVPDPFGGQPGARLYRTGDVVRRRWDGTLEFAGRSDQQIKIRGYRVEPGEIETAILADPSVRECTVQLRYVGDDKRLVAYFVPAAGKPVDGGALLDRLRGVLPGYLIPNHAIALDSLPATASGKLDAKALPEIGDEPAAKPADEPEPPRTVTEEALHAIWAGLLGRSDFGIDDDFFALGGHSLLATVAVTAIRERFRYAMPLPDFFDGPTIRRLAVLVEAGEATEPDALDELAAAIERAANH